MLFIIATWSFSEAPAVVDDDDDTIESLEARTLNSRP